VSEVGSKEINIAGSKQHVVSEGTVSYIHTKGEGEDLPRTGHERPKWELIYSCALSLTSALEGVGWSTPRPVRFTRGKDLVEAI